MLENVNSPLVSVNAYQSTNSKGPTINSTDHTTCGTVANRSKKESFRFIPLPPPRQGQTGCPSPRRR